MMFRVALLSAMMARLKTRTLNIQATSRKSSANRTSCPKSEEKLPDAPHAPDTAPSENTLELRKQFLTLLA